MCCCFIVLLVCQGFLPVQCRGSVPSSACNGMPEPRGGMETASKVKATAGKQLGRERSLLRSTQDMLAGITVLFWSAAGGIAASLGLAACHFAAGPPAPPANVRRGIHKTQSIMPLSRALLQVMKLSGPAGTVALAVESHHQVPSCQRRQYWPMSPAVSTTAASIVCSASHLSRRTGQEREPLG